MAMLLALVCVVSSWFVAGEVAAVPVAEVAVDATLSSTFSSISSASSNLDLSTTATFATPRFSSVLNYITVNDHYISFSESEKTWKASARIARMLRKSPLLTDPLRITIHFRRLALDMRILHTTVGHVALRPSNSTTELYTSTFRTMDQQQQQQEKPHYTMDMNFNLQHALDTIETFTPSGPHTLQIRLESSVVQEPLVLALGEIHIPSTPSPPPPPRGVAPLLSPGPRVFRLRVLDLLDGSFWRKFLDRCGTDAQYKETITTRLKWAELLISLFSMAYCTAVNWLGPLDFTPWQQRCYEISGVSSAAFQLVFLAWISETVSVCTVVPPAVSLGLLYFVAFNVLNVLILLEQVQPDQHENIIDMIQHRSPAGGAAESPRRTFDSIPSSTQLHGMTRVVMVGYRKARYC